MNAKKLLALVLALLMVIPAMSFGAAAEETVEVAAMEAPATEDVVYAFNTLTASENAYLDGSIGFGSVNNDNKNKPAWWGRYVDGSKYYGYTFQLQTTAEPVAATFTAEMRGDLLVELALNKTGPWVVVATLGEGEDQAADPVMRSFDLLPAIQELGGITGTTIHLRFGDGTPDGWGTCILSRTEAQLKLSYAAGTYMNIERISFQPSEDFSTEAPYFYAPALDSTRTTDGSKAPYYRYEKGVATNASCHFMDGTRRLVYAYELHNSAIPEQISLSFESGQQLRLSVSTNAFDWVTSYIWDGTPNADGSGGLSKAVRTFDLLKAYKEAMEADPSNMLYVSISDSHPDGGWGGSVYYGAPFALTIVWPERVATGEVVTLDFTVQGDDENDYFVGGGNVNGTTGRYADGSNKVVYKYPLTNVDTSSQVMLTGTFSSQLALEVSLDGQHWTRGFVYRDKGALFKLNMINKADQKPAQQDKFIFSSAERTFDLTAAVVEAGKIANSKDAIYIRIGDSHPTRIKENGTEMKDGETNANVSCGWGGQIHGNITLTVSEGTSMLWKTSESFTISQFTSNGTNYTLKSPEDVLVTRAEGADKEGSISALTVAAHASLMADNGDGTFTYRGTGTWQSRSADNSNYFIYRYQLPSNVDTLIWSATIGGGYGIDIAFGKADYATYKNELVWTNWANYVDDGHNATGNACVKKDLTLKLTEEQSKAECIYIKIYDYDYGTDFAISGSGGRIAIGSGYPISMTYLISVSDELHPTLRSANLNLTQNFNVMFKPAFPGTAKGAATVSIGWAGQALNTVTPDTNGYYNFIGIRPEHLSDEIAISFTGKCLDNSTYVSKPATYSVKDYCARMIAKNAGNTALVTLLSDILEYGRAAQVYSFAPENELVTNGVEGMTPTTNFTAPTALETVLSRAATEEDVYTWRAATLVLDTTTAIRYSFRVKGDAELPTIIMTHGKTANVVRAEDEEGTYYYFDIPVFANMYGTAYTAKFEGVDDYTLSYSVNHYIATKYDASKTKTAALLRAIYNYGVSVNAYIDSITQ